MPATAAHFMFGQLVCGALSELVKTLIQSDKDTFDLGLQGPDLLFFYNPLSANCVSNKGTDIHSGAARDFFEPALQSAFDDPAVLVYLLGCACHYALDSACHPFINAHFPTAVLHRQVETNFEERIIGDFDLSRKIHHYLPKKPCAAAVAQAYPDVTRVNIERAIQYMRFYTRALEHRKLISFGERVIGQKGVFSSLAIGNGHHFPDAMSHLKALFEQTVPTAVRFVKSLYEDHGTKTIRMENFNLNFEGAQT